MSLIYKKGKWISDNSKQEILVKTKSFSDIWWYPANIIDYNRILLCLVASYTITTDYHLTSAFLIYGSTLLDWFDGPIARYTNTCCIMGSGWDWMADILCQLLQVMWWQRFNPSVGPILFVVTTIELCNCIFDFAITATGKYPDFPNIPNKYQSKYYLICYWFLEKTYYNYTFYCAQWLAYPLFCIGMTLEHIYFGPNEFINLLFYLNRIMCGPLALLYIVYETLYLRHIISHWTEPK